MSWRQDRRHYHELKAQNRCVQCGVEKLPGVVTVRCGACNEKRNAARQEMRRK